MAKKRHIASKLLLNRSGLKVLDIGSGWGGLALEIAARTDANVLGVTLSTEQLAVARNRASASGLKDRCTFALRDYRQIDGAFDRIVSVGMFEHVGIGYYDAFFTKMRELLTPEGFALLHFIGRSDGPNAINPWIADLSSHRPRVIQAIFWVEADNNETIIRCRIETRLRQCSRRDG